jgi:hypothetical protein
MRKFERTGGIIALGLFLYSAFFGFDINFYVLLRVGLIIMSIFYLWFGFFLFNRIGFTDLLRKEVRVKISAFKMTAGMVMGMVYSFCILAVMFGVYFYSHMGFMLAAAAISLLSSTLLIGVYNTLNMPLQSFYNQFYRRSLIIGIILFAIWFTPWEKRLEYLYKNYPEFVEAYQKHRKTPNEPGVKEAIKEARSLFK